MLAFLFKGITFAAALTLGTVIVVNGIKYTMLSVIKPSIGPPTSSTAIQPVIPSPTLTLLPTFVLKQQVVSNEPRTQMVDCVGPDGKHLSVTQEECDNFNNAWKNSKNDDPIVMCRVNPACGPPFETRKSACDKLGCCEVNGSWKIYPDTDSCKNAQQAEYNQLHPTPTPSDILNWTAFTQCVSEQKALNNNNYASYCEWKKYTKL